jgi:hypothetical protein
LILGALPLSAAIASVACDGNGYLEVTWNSPSPGDAGPWVDVTVPEASPDDADATPDAADAGLSPVIVGITPSPGGDGDPTVGDVVEARLAALAAGARGMVVRRALRDLSADGLTELAQEGEFYAKHKTRLAMSLALVDRAADGRPAELVALPWDAMPVREAVHHAIDGVVGSLGDALAYLSIGRDVDVWLGAHPEQRAGFEALVGDAIGYAHEHAPGVMVGVGFSFDGAAQQNSSFTALLGASDIAVLTYLPGLGTTAAGPTSAVAGDADTMIARAGGKPIVLEALGYPSRSDVGGSDDKQALFLETFFGALAPRRAGFAFVNVEALHDLGAIRCAALTAAQGEPAGGPYAAYMCSLGLVTVTEDNKPAWPKFLKGAATFASP